MRQFLPLTIFIFSFLSCKTKTESVVAENSIQLLIPDTTKNIRAQSDLDYIEHCSEIAKQLGLGDLKKGVDSFEIRLWNDFSFVSTNELFILKLLDTTYSMTYYRLYYRSYDYDNENRNRQWNPFKQPIVDSCFSKTVLLKKDDLKSLNLQEIWSLYSQSELKIPDSVGFSDCYTNTIEVADKKRYKFMSHHCPNGYFEKLKLKDITNFTDYFQKIRILANKNNAIIRHKYD